MKNTSLSYIKLLFYTSLLGFVVAIDRLIKYLIMYHMPQFKITSFLEIQLMLNRGISWGVFHSNHHVTFAALNFVIGCIIVLFSIYTFMEFFKERPIIGEVMVLAGAISNYMDRFLYGGVVDFIAVYFGPWAFPIFNIADSFIVMGVCLILLGHYLKK